MNAHELRVFLKTHWYTAMFYIPLRNIIVGYNNWRMKKLLRRNFRLHGLEVVSTVNRIMEDNAIRYALDFGGLLGWVREGRFLPWDPDLDFAVLIDGPNTIAELRTALLSAGFVWKKEYFDELGRQAEDGYEINGIGVDFFYYYPENGAWRFSVFCITEQGIEASKRNVAKVVYSEPRGLKKMNIGGVQVSVPEDTEAALVERYGRSWRVPDKNWVPNPNDKQTRWNLGSVGRFVRH